MGVADRNIIPDFRMAASSLHSTEHYPYYARLNNRRGRGAWCPKTISYRTDYLQVDMGQVHTVCAVATHGARVNNWTTRYKVHFSLDGINWDVYKVNNVEKVNIFYSVSQYNFRKEEISNKNV